MHGLCWLWVTLARASSGDEAPVAPHVAQMLVRASEKPHSGTLGRLQPLRCRADERYLVVVVVRVLRTGAVLVVGRKQLLRWVLPWPSGRRSSVDLERAASRVSILTSRPSCSSRILVAGRSHVPRCRHRSSPLNPLPPPDPDALRAFPWLP